MPLHLRPTAPIAADALLPGDPKRAMEIATRLLERPLMSNLSRGLWGYHGHTADGRELTVQSTGLGGPSGAIVLAELAELGVRRAIRLGTCTALAPTLAAGDVVVATAALAGDGVGAALGEDEIAADATLTAGVAAASAPLHSGIVASTDLFHDHGAEAGRRRAWKAAGALAVDLSAAAVLAVGRRVGVAVACALVVAQAADGHRLGEDELDAAVVALAERAAGALGSAPQPAPEPAS